MGAAVGIIPAEFEQLTAEQKVSLEAKYAEQKEGGKTDEEIIAALTAETTAIKMSSAPIKFFYFPISARGEVSRMICKAGGLEIIDTPDASGEKLAEYGSPSGLPILNHGDLKINQSIAIQIYLESIAPKYKDLTAQQKAKDYQFMCLNEDLIQACAPPIFTEAKDFTTQIPGASKLLGLLEGLLPEEGYINGLEFPTAADFCVVHIFYGYMPIGAFAKHAKFDMSVYKRGAALAKRTKEAIGYDAATLTNAAFGV